jgi:hypothetical protein
MRIRHTTLAAGILAALLLVAVANAQQVTVGTPFHQMHDGFFENSQINWSGNYRGVNFSFGGGALAVPQYGGYTPNAGLGVNYGIAGKDGRINFSGNFGQGYNQSLTTQTPSVTLMNGQTGYVSDTSQTPFVVSVIPVVGAFPVSPQQLREMSGIGPNQMDPRLHAMMQARADAQVQAAAQAAGQAQAGGPVPPLPPQPNNAAPKRNLKLMNVPDPVPAVADPGDEARQQLDAAQKSTAGRPALSVAEAKRLHQHEQTAGDDEMAALMVRAQALEEDGKPNVAKIYYQRVAKHGTGDLQQQAQKKLYELNGK